MSRTYACPGHGSCLVGWNRRAVPTKAECPSSLRTRLRRSGAPSQSLVSTSLWARGYLAWAQEQYSLRPGKEDSSRVTFGTVRQLRSAASQFFAWDMMVCHPGSAVLDTKANRMLRIPCRITDDFSAGLLATGMGARIGNETKPSVALLERHVRWIDNDLDRRYRGLPPQLFGRNSPRLDWPMLLSGSDGCVRRSFLPGPLEMSL